MLSTDEDLFVCDMAETYHILDYKALPVPTLAVLASGLREDSRIKMKMAGVNYIPPSVVIPQIADRLTVILKILNGDKKKSKYLSDILFAKQTDEKPNGFHSGEDFANAWKRLTGEQNG